MSNFKIPSQLGTLGIPEFKSVPKPQSHPFQVSLYKVNDKVRVTVNKYSFLLNSPDPTDLVTVIGLDVPVILLPTDKIWLETFYDRNLNPVFAIINSAPKWLAETADGDNIEETTPVYPNQFEFISKIDLPNKISELDEVRNRVEGLRTSEVDNVNNLRLQGYIDDGEKEDLLQQISDKYTDLDASVVAYQSAMSNFFTGAPINLWRKLFRTYTLISYPTKNLNNGLPGLVVAPTPEVPATNPAQGSIVTAEEDSTFKIVQCVRDSLLLVDYSYQNRFPARLPIPFPTPISPFIIDGENEEEVNTSD